MTKINKMVMNGFKSFAKHTEVPFGDQYNCVLGPNGSGKCIVGNTDIQLANGSIKKIKDIVNKASKTKFKRIIDDGEIYYNGNEKIMCLDTTKYKSKSKKILAYVKRKSPKELIQIKTKTGKTITTTKYHPLFSLKNDKFTSLKAEELKKGTRIATPRFIDIKPKTLYFTELINLIKPSDKIYVPYNPIFKNSLLSIKNKKTYRRLAKEIKIPKNAIKGLMDKQSINFAYIVKILRYSNYSDERIIELIPKVKSKTSNILYKVPWKNSKEFSRFLGYLLAEGRLSNTSNQIWFTNGSPELVHDYIKCCKKIFDISLKPKEYKPSCWDVILYSTPLMKILKLFGLPIGSTEKKEISNLYLKHSSNSEISHLLDGLYSGDGYVSKSTIEITTKSKKLATAIESLLLRFGISHQSKYVIKIATNTGFSGIYKTIVISGVENFIRFNNSITVTHEKKQSRITQLINKVPNPNLDLIEVNNLIKKTTKELKINIKKTKKQFPRIDSYCYNQCTPSVYGVKKLISDVFVPVDKNNSKMLMQLKKLAESDIFWDEIIEIKKIKSKEKWVYDLCVEKDHNFIANNFFIHNSNILDALCFVLGKSSSKSLRAEKSANLIYNGGKSRKPAKKGEVSIFFDNENKTFPTDAKEVKISRIVRHSGQSVYKINDKTHTRQQIIDLLNHAKINQDGYNIILQGDIVRFVEMHPIERRQLIESISGISVYEEKKHKAMGELNRVDDRLKETEIVLTERNTYLKELKKDRNQALKYKDMSDKIKQNKASYLKIQIDNKDKIHKELQNKIDKSNQELKKINDNIEDQRNKIKERKQKIDQINKDIEEKGEVEQVKLNKEVESLKIEITKITSRIETCKSEVNKINQRRQDLNDSIKETNEKIEELKKQKQENIEAIEKKKREHTQIKIKLDQFKQKNKIDNLGDIEKDIESIDKESEEFQKKITKLREKQHNLIREKDKITHDISTIDAGIQKVLDVEKENKNQIQELKNKKQEFKNTVKKLNSLLDEDSNLSLQLNQNKSKLSKAIEQNEKLKAREISRREVTYADISIKKILDQKNNINGIHGTVADLGRVPSKYSLAMEIAAGPRIKSIVVENEKVASECIKYLKTNKLGIATFLPINKIKPRTPSNETKEFAKANGSHGNALDLIKFDKKYNNIFSYVFGDTVVIDNIDVARRLGIGKTKFVTLDGDLAEKSGVMQGGFRKKRKGMGFKEDDVKKELDKYKEEITNLTNSISTIEKTRENNEQLINQLRNTKADLEGNIIKTEKSLHLDPTDLDSSKEKKKDLTKQEDYHEEQINNTIKEVSNLNKDLAKLKIKKQELRSQISQLRNPTLIAELNTFEEKSKQLNENIIEVNSELKNIQTQIENIYTPEIEKTNLILKQLDKDQEKFQNEQGHLSKDIKNKKELLNKKEETAAEFYMKFKGLFNKRTKIDEEINKFDSKINQKLSDSRNIEMKNNTYSLKNAGIVSELAALKQDFQAYEGVKLDTSKTEDQLKYEIRKFENMRENIGNVNMRALEIYEEVESQYNNLLQKKDKLSKEKEDVLVMMEEIESKKKTLFMKTLEVVNENFKKFFEALSTKGDANLVLEDPENPFEAGLRINVKITGSKFLDIRSLSGGEKTLTALAFIFAIQEHEPASFYVLDEVDAALDKHNSEKLAKLVRKYCDNAQYVIISHNDSVISEADNLYGVSMNEHGMSKIVSLKI